MVQNCDFTHLLLIISNKLLMLLVLSAGTPERNMNPIRAETHAYFSGSRKLGGARRSRGG